MITKMYTYTHKHIDVKTHISTHGPSHIHTMHTSLHLIHITNAHTNINAHIYIKYDHIYIQTHLHTQIKCMHIHKKHTHMYIESFALSISPLTGQESDNINTPPQRLFRK